MYRFIIFVWWLCGGPTAPAGTSHRIAYFVVVIFILTVCSPFVITNVAIGGGISCNPRSRVHLLRKDELDFVINTWVLPPTVAKLHFKLWLFDTVDSGKQRKIKLPGTAKTATHPPGRTEANINYEAAPRAAYGQIRVSYILVRGIPSSTRSIQPAVIFLKLGSVQMKFRIIAVNTENCDATWGCNNYTEESDALLPDWCLQIWTQYSACSLPSAHT